MYKENTKRNYSVDILRIVAMLMIITLHSGSHGRLLALFDVFSPYNIYFHWINCLCTVSVNCYVLISGYFLIDSHFNIKHFQSIIIETVFYSWVVLLCMLLSGNVDLSNKDAIIRSLFPISFRNNWFVTAYIGMYLLFPVLNYAIKAVDRKKHKGIIILLVCMFGVYQDIPTVDPWFTLGGYTFIWFIVLYWVAAYIKRYVRVENISRSRAGIVYLLGASVMMFSWILISVLKKRYYFLENYTGYYIRYNSIAATVSSVSLFLFALSFKVSNERIIRLIRVVAPSTFGVYLIHDNPFIREVLWNRIVAFSLENINPLFPLKVVGIIFLIFTICSIIDIVRGKFFSGLCNIRYIQIINQTIEKKYQKIAESYWL